MSYNGIAVSEKHSDVEFSPESRSGIPFNFLMRDILQFDNSLNNTIRYDPTHHSLNLYSGHCIFFSFAQPHPECPQNLLNLARSWRC